MTTPTKLVCIAQYSCLKDRIPVPARVADVDLIVLRVDDNLSVLLGRCPHRGGRLEKGRIEGDHLICPYHGWDFQVQSGQSTCLPGEAIERFPFFRQGDDVLVDEEQIRAWRRVTPLAFENEDLLGPDDGDDDDAP